MEHHSLKALCQNNGNGLLIASRDIESDVLAFRSSASGILKQDGMPLLHSSSGLRNVLLIAVFLPFQISHVIDYKCSRAKYLG